MHKVTLTLTDNSGRTATCDVNVTAKDVSDPTFTCPSNRTINLGSTCNFSMPNLVAIVSNEADNCSIASFSQNPSANSSHTSKQRRERMR